MKGSKMFKKGDFIVDKDNKIDVYKVIKLTYDLGHNRIYILRPKGFRNDRYDREYNVRYVNQNFILVKDRKFTLMEALQFMAKGAC